MCFYNVDLSNNKEIACAIVKYNNNAYIVVVYGYKIRPKEME